MSWEVSSMQSKRSFFNLTLFKKNLSRSWPLWGGVTAVGCLAPLYALLALIQIDERYPIESSDFAELLYPVATYFVPAASFGYAILVAMVVWSYLYNNRSVGLMHTLPIDRTGLFITNTLSGFAMLLIPYVAVGGFTCILALLWGFMDIVAVMTTVATVLLLTVLFFGMATLCAMITGNVFALPVFYLILNFVAPALDWLVSTLAQSFLLGMGNDYTGAVEFLSPLVQIYQSFRWDGVYVTESQYEYVLTGFGTVAIYGLVGLLMFGLALALYLRRKSETAGDVVAFRWLRPVFRYGVALAFALTTGRALYALIWGSLFQSGNYAEAVPMAFCMAIAGLTGYYVASMLLEKSLRVFRGSALGAIVVVAVCAVICAGISMDLFGVESYVPEMEDIDTVYVSTSNMVGRTPALSAEKNPELVEMTRDLHSTIVAEADELKAYENRSYAIELGDGEMRECSRQYVRFTYHLKDGSTILRSYTLYLEREAWEQETGIEGAFKTLFASSEIQVCQVLSDPVGELASIHAYCYEDDRNSYDEAYALNIAALHRAVLADAEAGNLYDYDLFDDYYNENYPVTIDVEYRVWDEDYYDKYRYDYVSIELRPTMIHTIRELLSQEFITLEDLQQWDKKRELKQDYKVYEMAVKAGYSGPETISSFTLAG